MNHRLLVVMLGAFVAQTTEYLPIGLLPQIGHSFGVSASDVGILVTGYAWLAALTAIPLTLATNRLDRRTLFLALLVVIGVANLVAASSRGYAMLATTRTVTALTHGLFWSILAAFATRLAPEMPAGRALAWAFGGISLAVVAGVPVATAIGQWAGWREAFNLFGATSLTLSLAGILLLPSIPAHSHEAERRFPRGNAPLYGAALATACIIAAHFCAYTYIARLMISIAGVLETNLPLLLFVFGLAGVVGTLIAGCMGFRPSVFALMAATGIVASQALMMAAGGHSAVAWLDMILWGSSLSMLIVGLQAWVLELAPQQADAASALYVAAFNTGIGAGAMIGGLSLEVAGDRYVLRIGVVLGVIACACFSLPPILAQRASVKTEET